MADSSVPLLILKRNFKKINYYTWNFHFLPTEAPNYSGAASISHHFLHPTRSITLNDPLFPTENYTLKSIYPRRLLTMLLNPICSVLRVVDARFVIHERLDGLEIQNNRAISPDFLHNLPLSGFPVPPPKVPIISCLISILKWYKQST